MGQYKVCSRFETNQWCNLCRYFLHAPPWHPNQHHRTSAYQKANQGSTTISNTNPTFGPLLNIYLHFSYNNSLMHRAPGTTRFLFSPPTGWGRSRAELNRLGRWRARPGNVNVRTNLCPMSFKGAVAVKATAVRSLSASELRPAKLSSTSHFQFRTWPKPSYQSFRNRRIERRLKRGPFKS